MPDTQTVQQRLLAQCKALRPLSKFTICQDMSSEEMLQTVQPIIADSTFFTEVMGILLTMAQGKKGTALQALDLPSYCRGATSSLIIYQNPRVQLSIAALDPLEMAEHPSGTLAFTMGATLLCCPLDQGLELLRFDKVESQTEPPHCIAKGRYAAKAGEVIAINNAEEAIVPLRPRRPAIMLRALILPSQTELATGDNVQLHEHFDMASGRLLRQSDPDAMSTKRQMLIGLLRHMGVDDALPLMLQATHHGVAAMRWQAMRECLATDMARSWARLQAMADCDPDAEVQAIASQTLDFLKTRKAA